MAVMRDLSKPQHGRLDRVKLFLMLPWRGRKFLVRRIQRLRGHRVEMPLNQDKLGECERVECEDFNNNAGLDELGYVTVDDKLNDSLLFLYQVKWSPEYTVTEPVSSNEVSSAYAGCIPRVFRCRGSIFAMRRSYYLSGQISCL